MSGGKETGRQKMIGMMYLVLTALLAMNISKDVLLAFITIEANLGKTNENFKGKNQVMYDKFEKMMSENPTKTKPWRDKAFQIRDEAENFCKYVDGLKSELFMTAQKALTKEKADTLQLKHAQENGVTLDDYDTPTNYLIGNVEKPNGKGVELKEKIRAFRNLVLSMVPEKEKAGFKIGLITDDLYDSHAQKTLPWEVFNFDHTTMAASMALLETVKNEVRNAESDLVGILLREIDAGDFKFDMITARVVAPTSYIVLGEEYTADIFVAAYSTTKNPEILVGKVDTTTKTIVGPSTPVPVEAGLGKYTVRPTAEGLQTWSGLVNVTAPDGTVKSYPFESNYMVAKPSFAVSPTKMNVFYIGVPNPVDISVAGAAPTNVVPSLVGSGRIDNKGQGHYEVTVTGGTECTVNVAIKDPRTNTTKSMGAGQKFRIRKVPSPVAKFAGVTGDGSVTLGEMQAAGGCIADLSDFVFDLKFPVTKWTMSMNINGLFQEETARGASITPGMKALLSKAKKGSKILIEDVHVQAPDGDRKIVGCNIKIK
ncbi:MAG: gliding motility protein GldM [Bacteroidia bacterium]|jgi:gliding motility-associated protein GldM